MFRTVTKIVNPGGPVVIRRHGRGGRFGCGGRKVVIRRRLGGYPASAAGQVSGQVITG